MGPLSITVLGAGVAGLSAALALGRAGHRVMLVERDAVQTGEPAEAVRWERHGIPHFLQPHAVIPRGRKELGRMFPDVLETLHGAGASAVDLRPKIQGPPRPGDEELAYVGVRRPVIEWALRRAVLREPGIIVRSGVVARALVGDPQPRPRVTGVATTEGVIEADLVVDALGRRTPTPGWLEALGGRRPAERSSDCGILYYSRYYRTRDGATLPDGPWIPGPRGDLGYGAFSTFPGDNRTFAAIIAIPPGDQPLKALRHPPAFDAATASMPALHTWTNRDTSEPIGDVLAMGSLRNRLYAPAWTVASGLISIGDALCHTDPVLALGIPFGLIHSAALVEALDAADDVREAAVAWDTMVRPDIEERFRQTSAIDEARTRRWAGEAVDIARHDGGAYELFALAAGSAAAMADGDVLRAVVRRNTLLDRVGKLDGDALLIARIEQLFAELMARPRPPVGPPRDRLVELLRAAGSA